MLNNNSNHNQENIRRLKQDSGLLSTCHILCLSRQIRQCLTAWGGSFSLHVCSLSISNSAIPTIFFLMKLTALFVFCYLSVAALLSLLALYLQGGIQTVSPPVFKASFQPLLMLSLQGVPWVFVNIEAVHVCAKQTIFLTASCPPASSWCLSPSFSTGLSTLSCWLASESCSLSQPLVYLSDPNLRIQVPKKLFIYFAFVHVRTRVSTHTHTHACACIQT